MSTGTRSETYRCRLCGAWKAYFFIVPLLGAECLVGRDNSMGNKCLWGVLLYVAGQNHTESRKRFGIITRSSRGAQGYHADSVKDLQFGVYLQGDEAFSCNPKPS